MKLEIDVKLLKDILLEQWNEGGLTSDEVLNVYEANIEKSLDEKSKKIILKILVNWANYGLKDFVSIEKIILERNQLNYHIADKFVDDFITSHFNFE